MDRARSTTTEGKQPRRGEKDSFWTLFNEEAPRLTGFFRRRVGVIDDVSDLVQETFLRLLRAGVSRELDNPRAYLHRIAWNLLNDRWKRSRRQGPCESLDEDVAVPVEADQDQRLEAAELMEAYRAAVANLPTRTREVFVLQRRDGLSYKEIAERLGIGVRTVEWHVAQALLRIRRAIDAA